MHGANCSTDHLMIRAKLKISIHQKSLFNGVKVSKWIEVENPVVRNSLKSAYEQVNFSDCDWEIIKDIIYEKGVEILRLRVPRH